MDAIAEEKRKRADEDFDITLRVRRSSELARQVEEQAAAEAKAAKTVADAEEQAGRLLAAAREEVRRLQTVREETRGQLEAMRQTLGTALTQARPQP